ncbi:hypothetical protein [Kitasatospora sp. NPDC056531]|uniref:hypothetical protein n=1 Tax=Kitasatospora sp. NPDC056531 TaxID=3345856 RepID=UPI0036AB7D1F
MGLWSKLTGGQTASTTPAGRTPRERARRARDIERADANTANWLRRGGLAPRKGR